MNGAEVVGNVWEASPDAASEKPPFCDPQMPDGIGRWRCVLYGAPEASAPRDFNITVGEDGSIRFEGEKEPRACCIEVDGREARAQGQ